jgi:hypothetical protein
MVLDATRRREAVRVVSAAVFMPLYLLGSAENRIINLHD